MTPCVQCRKPTNFTGEHPELFAICDDCRDLNRRSRMEHTPGPGRPRHEPQYDIGSPIPGSHLTPYDYSTQPPTYTCICGTRIQVSRYAAETLQRKTCSICTLCSACRIRRTRFRFLHIALCEACQCSLLSTILQTDSPVTGTLQTQSSCSSTPKDSLPE